MTISHHAVLLAFLLASSSPALAGIPAPLPLPGPRPSARSGIPSVPALPALAPAAIPVAQVPPPPRKSRGALALLAVLATSGAINAFSVFFSPPRVPYPATSVGSPADVAMVSGNFEAVDVRTGIAPPRHTP